MSTTTQQPEAAVSPAPAARPSNPAPEQQRNWWWTLLAFFTVVHSPSMLTSAAIHGGAIVFFALATIHSERRRPAMLDTVAIDTSLERKDIFESLAWEETDEPALRQPGSGPLDNALSMAEQDPLRDLSSKTLAGLAPSTIDPDDAGLRDNDGGEKNASIADGLEAGSGPGVGFPEFFGNRAKGSRIVYVIDRSMSMRTNDAWDRAVQELIASLSKLSPVMQFQVIFYNTEPVMLDLSGNSLVPANKANIERAIREIRRIPADGGTLHEKALQKALSLSPKPDVIFHLTDAEEDSNDKRMVNTITRLNQQRGQGRTPATIHVIQFSHDLEGKANNDIKQLATKNGRGNFRFIDTNKAEARKDR